MALGDDQELLQSYTRYGSQDAFRQLVERHVNLVYSSARRLLSDEQLAQDVVQQVFIIFARKAGTLGADVIIPGWLYRTARHLASEALRREQRRTRNEQMATQGMSLSSDEATWKHIEPLLEDAMACLRSSDNDAIVLRYFEGKTLKEVGEALGLSQDAAQKRIARALDRLRIHLQRRGVTVSAPALGAAIIDEAVQCAPSGLASSISAAAGPSWSAHASIGTSKLKVVGIAATIGVLSLGLVMLLRQNASLRREMGKMRESLVTTQLTTASNQPAISNDGLRRARLEHLELLALRGRVTQLLNELRQRTNAAGQANPPADAPFEPVDSILFTAALTNRVANGHSLVIGGWPRDGRCGYLLATPVIKNDDAVTRPKELAIHSQVIAAPEAFWEQIGWGTFRSDMRRSTLSGVLTAEEVEALLKALKEHGGEISNRSSGTTLDGNRIGLGFATEDNQGVGMLMGIDLYPRVSADGESVDLELCPSAIPAKDVHNSLKGSSESGLSPSP